MDKTFLGDFYMMLERIQKRTPTAFARFSDGELAILEEKPTGIRADGTSYRGKEEFKADFPAEDVKSWGPQDVRTLQLLRESLQYWEPGYFQGLICRCCIGQEGTDFMRQLAGAPEDHQTWSNLFVNDNYKLFVEEMVPLFKDYKVVLTCHTTAVFNEAPFDVIQSFPVGTNCIHDHDIIQQMYTWIEENDIQDHLFLFAASSLSNMLIAKMWKHFKNNIYLDVGTCLHPYLKLSIQRDYLRGYWQKRGGSFANRVCIW